MADAHNILEKISKEELLAALLLVGDAASGSCYAWPSVHREKLIQGTSLEARINRIGEIIQSFLGNTSQIYCECESLTMIKSRIAEQARAYHSVHR